MCAICREKQSKYNLVRIVNNSENGVCVDASGKMNGRGAYICTQGNCIDQGKAKNALEGALKTAIANDAFKKIQESVHALAQKNEKIKR